MTWTRSPGPFRPGVRAVWLPGPWHEEPNETIFRYYDLLCVMRRDFATGCWTAYVEDPSGSHSFRCSTAMYPNEAEPTCWSFLRFDSEDRPLTGQAAFDYVSYDEAIDRVVDFAREVHFRAPGREVHHPALHPVFFVDCKNTSRVVMGAPWPTVRVGKRSVPLYGPQSGKDFDDVVQIVADHLADCERLGRDPVWFQDEVEEAKDSLPEILKLLEKPSE